MDYLSERNFYIPIPFPYGRAPHLHLTSQESALKNVLTTKRLAAAAPVLWENLKERCRVDQRLPSHRREWLEFRHRAIIKRVGRARANLNAPALAKALREVTEANLLCDNFLSGVEALCSLRRDQDMGPQPKLTSRR